MKPRILATVLIAAGTFAAGISPAAASPSIYRAEVNDDGHVPVLPVPGSWNGQPGLGFNVPSITGYDTPMGPNEQRMADEFLDLVNAERAARGMSELSVDAYGTRRASATSHRNAGINTVAHSSTNSSFGTISEIVTYPDVETSSWVNEAVTGNSGGYQVSGPFIKFMRSDAHRAGLLDPRLSHAGIGVSCQRLIVGGEVRRVSFVTFIGVVTDTVPQPDTPDISEGLRADLPGAQGARCDDGTSGDDALSPNWTGDGSVPTDVPASIADADDIIDLVNASDYDPAVHGDVLRLYRAFFDREPDVDGARYWIGVRDSRSLIEIADYFTGSVEYANNYAGTSDREFLEAVYVNVLDRRSDNSGFVYWLDLLEGTNNSGNNTGRQSISRGEVVRWVTASAEFKSAYPYLPE